MGCTSAICIVCPFSLRSAAKDSLILKLPHNYAIINTNVERGFVEDTMVILHLSDIHFGRNNPEYNVRGEFSNKKAILQELITSIKDNTIKPDHILVTGDIAWYGKKQDFDEALIWFKELLKATNLSGENITFCPGNHDVNRSYGNYKTDIKYTQITAIDEIYNYDCVHKMEAPLCNYDRFCESLGVMPYHYPKNGKWEASYSIGYKDISSPSGEVFRIVSFNSALLSFVKGFPDDQMLIGQPQVIELLNQNIISENRNCFTIAIFHHAERFLHTHEICEYDYRYATLPLLRRYVDLVLCGHTETGGIPVLYRQMGGAKMLTGGAAYYSDDHANSYSLVIVADNCKKPKEHDICFMPFTYSIERGWYHNVQKEHSSEKSNIAINEPTINCRAEFELRLEYEDQRLSIPMKSVSVYTHENNTATLNNYEDVCRNLDIVCSGPTDKPGTSNVSIKIAHTKESSVEALLMQQKVFSFLNRATKAQNGSSFKIIASTGSIILSGDSIRCEEKIDEEGIDFLTRLRKVELHYDLLFQRPDDNSEYRKVDVLNDIIDFGYTTAFKAIPGLETYSSNRNQLFKFGLIAMRNKPVYILHRGKFRCRLYGNDFSLGEATVLMGPYTTKGSRAFRKAFTFFKDDQRKIQLTLSKNSICYIITDETRVNIPDMLSELGEHIEVKNMDCVWDFIYEVDK